MLKIDSGRVRDPVSISASEIAEASHRLGTLIVQFSRPSAYPVGLLESLNEACRLAGHKLQVRFYGHYDSPFDAMVLRHLPNVENLSLDSLTSILNEEEVGALASLTRLHFAVFELNRPDFLSTLQLDRFENLGVGENRQRNLDLSPLARCAALQTLFIHGHSKSVKVIGALPQLRDLSFSGFPASVPLDFVSSLPQLEHLRLLLGSRADLSEVSNPTLEGLQIMRIRGLTTLGDLQRFPLLRTLSVEDQAQLTEIDLTGLKLKNLRLQNCKTLRDLIGIEEQDQLEDFFAYKLAINWDHLRDRSWPKGSSIVLGTGSRKWNEDARRRLNARGLSGPKSRKC